jgi:hypothetical protein
MMPARPAGNDALDLTRYVRVRGPASMITSSGMSSS